MATDPDRIRSTIATLLASMPESDAPDADIEAIAARLEEAHEHLVGALESVERGAEDGAATWEMGPTSEST